MNKILEELSYIVSECREIDSEIQHISDLDSIGANKYAWNFKRQLGDNIRNRLLQICNTATIIAIDIASQTTFMMEDETGDIPDKN